MKGISIKQAKEVFIIWLVMCSPLWNSLWIHLHCLRQFMKWLPSILSLCIHPALLPYICSSSPPLPNNTEPKTTINASRNIDRYLRSSSFSGNFHDSLSNSCSFQHGPSRAVPYLHAPLLFPTVFCSVFQPNDFLEDCCLITLRSHSSPPVHHWRPESGSFSFCIFLVLCTVVNLFNVCSELINDSTQPSFLQRKLLHWW